LDKIHRFSWPRKPHDRSSSWTHCRASQARFARVRHANKKKLRCAGIVPNYGHYVVMHTLPTAELTGASKARIVMFRSAASHDGSASKYELKPRSVGAFFCPHHLSAPSRRCQHLRQRTGAGASASREAGNSCVGWLAGAAGTLATSSRAHARIRPRIHRRQGGREPAREAGCTGALMQANGHSACFPLISRIA
jgi:hypothetical protein